ncbi:T9SS type A sorting domain-containing protein [Psychroserpens algicola]|uniref:T9SS type A sorting domain-containing protein n=1 Tax=Psychroserpens algicola TaxID=1719034 RepID=UPI001953B61B|nr:T9SS type A sorting domain-containing protein [Psychroserpens algicola]
MKNFTLLLALCSTLHCFAQFEVNIIDLNTNDLVYDAVTDKIYASIPSSNGTNGNSIGIINLDTYELESTVFIGSEPSVLAISDNGQYIYSGFEGSATVRRFDVTNLTADIQFPLGSDSSTGSFFAEDIEVMPNNPTTIAISRKNIGFTPRHEGVAIYDNNIMRTNTTQDHTGSNKIEFTGTNSLLGYNNETTEFGIRTLSVNASGISENTVTNNILSGFGVDFIYNNNRVYATNGQILDVTTTPFSAGQFTGASGPVAYDEFLDKVCYATFSGSSAIRFQRYNPNNFLIEDDLVVNEATGESKSMITCGNGCYAFNSENNKVVIIRDTNLSVTDFTVDNTFKLYPNPTSNVVTIDVNNDIETIQLIDINGKLIKHMSGNHNNNTIDLTHLRSGLYLVKVVFYGGHTATKRITKS